MLMFWIDFFQSLNLCTCINACWVCWLIKINIYLFVQNCVSIYFRHKTFRPIDRHKHIKYIKCVNWLQSFGLFFYPIEIGADACKTFWFLISDNLWIPRYQSNDQILMKQWSASITMANSTLWISRICAKSWKIVHWWRFNYFFATFDIGHRFHCERLQFDIIILQSTIQF